jgi:hypothetical protein
MSSYRGKHPFQFWYWTILFGIVAVTCVGYNLLVLLQVGPVGAGLR